MGHLLHLPIILCRVRVHRLIVQTQCAQTNLPLHTQTNEFTSQPAPGPSTVVSIGVDGLKPF